MNASILVCINLNTKSKVPIDMTGDHKI